MISSLLGERFIIACRGTLCAGWFPPVSARLLAQRTHGQAQGIFEPSREPKEIIHRNKVQGRARVSRTLLFLVAVAIFRFGGETASFIRFARKSLRGGRAPISSPCSGPWTAPLALIAGRPTPSLVAGRAGARLWVSSLRLGEDQVPRSMIGDTLV